MVFSVITVHKIPCYVLNHDKIVTHFMTKFQCFLPFDDSQIINYQKHPSQSPVIFPFPKKKHSCSLSPKKLMMSRWHHPSHYSRVQPSCLLAQVIHKQQMTIHPIIRDHLQPNHFSSLASSQLKVLPSQKKKPQSSSMQYNKQRLVAFMPYCSIL